MRRSSIQDRKAFTLIELLLVIGIIAVLASIVVLAVNPARQLAQSRNAARKQDVKHILEAIQQYVVGRGALPAGIDTTLRMIGTDATGCGVSCALEGIPATFGNISRRVAASTDDAEEITPPAGSVWMYVGSSDLEMTYDPNPTHEGDQFIGIRFTALAIPQGATITDARVTFTTTLDDSLPSSGAAAFTIYGQAANTTATFNVNIATDISSRTRTSSSIVWSPAEWLTDGELHDTVDISSILQEIVSRPGWASGNSIVLMIGGTGRRVAVTYDGNPSTAPLLTISYAMGTDISATTCLNLNTLSGAYMAALPKDPKLGTAIKTYYAMKKLPSGRLFVQACGAELGERITVQQ